MIAPPIGVVFLGGLVAAPLFGALCAWIAQRRYRRAMSVLLKKPYGAVAAPPMDQRFQRGVVLGIGLGMLGLLTAPDGFGQEPAAWQVALRWVALAGIALTLVNAVRLARAGMRPEPNFRIGDGVGGSSLGKPAAPAGTADLLDAREL